MITNKLPKLLSRSFGILITAIVFISFYGCNKKDSFNSEPENAAEIEVKVETLLSQMTLEEKIGQMSQVRHFSDIAPGDVKNKYIGSVIHTDGPTPGEMAEDWQNRFRELQDEALSTKLGIPLLFGVDAVHGQNTFNGATIFPHNIGMGATNNPDLVKRAAEITAIEAQATGFNWTFSPCIAIPYNERWGRVYEAFSESTSLTQKMVKASIQGHQGELSDSKTVMATVKHYIADGSTDFGIEGGNSSQTIQEVLERLLPPYRDAVNEGVGAVMVSFNTLLGLPMHAHKELITDTLKNVLGFDGIILTDWKGYSRFGEEEIINAGVDMVMAVDGDLDFFQKDLTSAVENGIVSPERIDDAVRRILRQKFRLNLFNNPYSDTSLISLVGSPDHRDIARQAVRESLVLLKNKDNTLPIQAGRNKIVVVGEHANSTGLQSGGWTIHWQGTGINYKGGTTILDGIKEHSKGEVVYDSLATLKVDDADVAIIVVGETPYAEFMGDIRNDSSKYQLTLTDSHIEYINSYADKVEKLVIILVSGRPLVTTKQIKQSDAFVAAWLPGSEGDGIAEVLFGNYNFTGKLPHSWPESVEDFNGKYGPNCWESSIIPLFEYGFGLSY
ncbi:MAG: glycoside hydrolase family 3 N-terminal domain-containing protein [Bacteroidota bacterium]